MTDNTEAFPPVHDPMAPVTSSGARPVRAGTVTWGVIMVAIAAMYFASTQLELNEVSGWEIAAWGALILGTVLVVGGLIAAVTRRNP
jgi:hypothetical protein